MKMNPLAGKPAPLASRVNVPRLVTTCFSNQCARRKRRTLNDEDRASVFEIARQTLAGFLPDSASKEKT